MVAERWSQFIKSPRATGSEHAMRVGLVARIFRSTAALIWAIMSGLNRGVFSLRYLTSGFETRSEEHTSELQSLMRISYAVFCLKKKHKQTNQLNNQLH